MFYYLDNLSKGIEWYNWFMNSTLMVQMVHKGPTKESSSIPPLSGRKIQPLTD